MDPILGQITLWPVNFIPQDWAACNGQLLNINANTALYSLLGTFFGGDAKNTFGLPDFRGRAPIGVGQLHYSSSMVGQTYTFAQFGGTEAGTATLTQANLPAHIHAAVADFTGVSVTIYASNAGGTDNVPGTNNSTTLAACMNGRSAGYAIYNSQTPNTALKANAAITGTPTVAIGATGNGAPFQFDNRSPYLPINFILATVGIYPTRS
ncbi:MAG: tail fiber protein [Paludibacteraceae bacterium]|nr:tail fiber protein [Paludibacteraceae bacterium]